MSRTKIDNMLIVIGYKDLKHNVDIQRMAWSLFPERCLRLRWSSVDSLPFTTERGVADTISNGNLVIKVYP